MSLRLLSTGNSAICEDATTGERGQLVRMINGTGSASVKGSVVACSKTVDKQFILQASEFDAFAVVAEAGIADGSECWLWVSGSTCQVLWKDGESSTRGYLALCADTDGRALNVDVPSTNPVVGEHFKEIGHPQESKSAGTDVLVLCTLHFL